jgi:UDP-GlcNAc:undecaprenyl-phosphate/decaprenyl-phosphate GlcNAc-1-phosphate transferase
VLANPIFLAIGAFGCTLLLIPLVRRLATRWGCVVQPTQARWHKRPTPTLGGVAVFAGCFVPVLAFAPNPSASLPVLLIAAQMFAVGLYDDLHQLHPVTKLLGQLSAAATALFFGYSLNFFAWAPMDAVLTVLWIIGLTNAVNLLDNMDGLAGGIGLIAALYLAFFFLQHDDPQHVWLALALAGALAGFLVFNVYPASIFMGDAGSLVFGSMLSLLAIRAHGQASNIFSLVAVPTCLLLVPILDTGLVTLTRILRGQAISQGGRDHVSHRLVVMGLSEPQAVLCLYVMAAISGGTALWIEQLSYTLSVALLPLIILSCVLFTAYVSQVEILAPEEGYRRAMARRLPALFLTLTYKRRLFEVLLDFCLMAFAYYLAFALRFDFILNAAHSERYLTSLPIVLIASFGAFFAVGVYRGVWRYTGFEDHVRLGLGVAGGTAVAAVILVLLYDFVGYSRSVLVLYALVLFLAVAGSRLSFRLFALLLARRHTTGVPVLIYGADDGGALVVQECRRNPGVRCRPIGFLDDDPHKQGRLVLGLPVLGGSDRLAEILQRQQVQGLIISSPSIMANGRAELIRTVCEAREVWIKALRLEFVEME